jgi:hypothetical protein
MVRSVQTVHLCCVKISTIPKWNESSFCLSLVTYEYHWMCLKWFLSLWYVSRKRTNLAPKLALSPNGPKWDSTWTSRIGLSSGASITISEPMVCSAQSMHLSYVKICTLFKRTESSFHLEVSLGAAKTISEPMVCLAQTMQLSCIDTNTISKRT